MAEHPPRIAHAALAALVGRTCECPSAASNDTTYFLFRFGDATLQVECLWRIVESGRLRVTSADHGHPYGLQSPVDARAQANSILRGLRVTAVLCGSVDADVVVVFGDGLRLEVLPDSSGYESWQLFGAGARILGWGGGQVSEL